MRARCGATAPPRRTPADVPRPIRGVGYDPDRSTSTGVDSVRKSSVIVIAGAIAMASIAAACGGDDEPTNAERPEDVTPEVLAESEIPTPTAIPVVIEPEELTYTVEPGDLLGTVAQRFGLTLDELLAANPQITDPNTIQVGDVVTIPEASDAAAPEAPAADPGVADDPTTADDATIPDN